MSLIGSLDPDRCMCRTHIEQSHPIAGLEAIWKAASFFDFFTVYPPRALFSEAGPELEGTRNGTSPPDKISTRGDQASQFFLKIYAALVFLYHIFRPDIIIFAPSAFTKPANEIPITTSVLYGWVAVLVAPAHIYSMVSQGILNQRLRVFAGQHKLDLLLNAALFFLSYAEYMEGALGETHGKGDKVTLEGILTSVLMLVRLYQMWVLPSVDQNADDEENE